MVLRLLSRRADAIPPKDIFITFLLPCSSVQILRTRGTVAANNDLFTFVEERIHALFGKSEAFFYEMYFM